MKFRTLLKHLKPKYLREHSRGYCPVCARQSVFIFTDRRETIRNHALCVRCGSCSRNRHLAHWILEEFRDRGILTLRDFGRHPQLKVLNTNSTEAIAKALGREPGIVHSEFLDGVPFGAEFNGVRNEDLQALTFADDSLDLVITEDVFEHVPDFRRGFQEVHRVLKPGGCHIFTIPFYFNRKTVELFRMENGNRVLTEPIEFHGDPIRGKIPCFVHIGYDLIPWLEDLGMEARVEVAWQADRDRIGAFDCFTLVTRKR